jgi:hypothetical protein
MRPLQTFIIVTIVFVGAFQWLWHSPEQGPNITPIASHQQSKEQPAQDNVLIEQTVFANIQPPSPPASKNITPEAVAPRLKTAVPSFAQMPIELREMTRAYFIAYGQGNYEFAALIALDAIEISDDYPGIKIMMHTGAGRNYEKLGFIGMAVEQYQLALTISPEHRPSYKALRRLDPEFAASHPELLKPERKKPATRPPTTTTTTLQ